MGKMKEPGATVSEQKFELDGFLPYRLSVAAEVTSRLISRQYLDRTGLAIAEWRLLAVVGRVGVLSPTTAGTLTKMDKVKISRAAAALIARGLVRQNNDPKDGRGRLLRLTRKGAALHADVEPTAQEIEVALSAGLTKAEWATLHKALGKLSDHVEMILQQAE